MAADVVEFSKDSLVSLFTAILTEELVSEFWDSLSGDSGACFRHCCVIAGLSPQEALQRIQFKRDSGYEKLYRPFTPRKPLSKLCDVQESDGRRRRSEGAGRDPQDSDQRAASSPARPVIRSAKPRSLGVCKPGGPPGGTGAEFSSPRSRPISLHLLQQKQYSSPGPAAEPKTPSSGRKPGLGLFSSPSQPPAAAPALGVTSSRPPPQPPKLTSPRIASGTSVPAKVINIPKVDPQQAENVLWYHYDILTDTWTPTEGSVCIHPNPFQEGTMRTAFHLFDLAKPEGQNHFVCKISKDPQEDTATYFDDVEMQALVRTFAEAFNHLGPPKKVSFVEASLIKCLERRGQPILAVEPFIAGKYIKHSNNYGFVSEEDRNTPQAFSHFSFFKSNGEYLICDIQGVQDKYTDPQIHSRDGTGFGKGNMGPEGMAKFFQTHRCNAICRLLRLPPHHPKQVDVGTIGRVPPAPVYGAAASASRIGELAPLQRRVSGGGCGNGGSGSPPQQPLARALPVAVSSGSQGGGVSSTGGQGLAPRSLLCELNSSSAGSGGSHSERLSLAGPMDPRLQRLFDQCDKGRRGYLDREGFLMLCARLGRRMSSKDAVEIIAMVNPSRKDRLDLRGVALWWSTNGREHQTQLTTSTTGNHN